jgi:hypothetical protein
MRYSHSVARQRVTVAVDASAPTESATRMPNQSAPTGCVVQSMGLLTQARRLESVALRVGLWL